MYGTIAMDTTDGLSRGLEVVDTGAPISVPVGKKLFGRIFNVLGDAIDGEKRKESCCRTDSPQSSRIYRASNKS